MDAIVLVVGQGTRLRPLTDHRHKSLVPVCNRPLIDYLFGWLAAGGCERIVLALGQHNEDLAAAYPGDGVYGAKLVRIFETSRLESGGAIRNAVREAGIEGPFIAVNGDLFVDFGLRAAIAAHRANGAELTMALHQVADPSQFGVAVVDERHLITAFVEKPPPGEAPSNLINAGVWIFEAGLVAEIPAGAVRVEETLFPTLVGERRRVLGYSVEGTWADVGTPARYLALHHALLGEQNAVAPGAAVNQRAVLSGTSIGAGGSVEASSSITDSVLWEYVSVGLGATIEASVIADNASIGPGATVRGAVIGRGAVVDAGAVVSQGTVIASGGRYDAKHDR